MLKKIIKIILILISINVFSAEKSHSLSEKTKHVHGAHKECALPESTTSIIECALKFHPSIKKSLLTLNSAALLKEKASQIPNPTISSRYIRGNNTNESMSELETNLTFSVELGGKRNSRKDYALASESDAMAEAESIGSDIKTMTILNLYRLRQVLTEEKVIKETLEAFSKVVNQLRKLPRLSAEQEASLILFEVALEETKINESEIFEEERKLEHYFHIATGHSLEEIRPFLPKSYVLWPSVTLDQDTGLSPEVRRFKSLSDLARKEVEIERSNAWPDLKIGPSLTIEKDGVTENKMIGFNISIPLPLFQKNGGGVAYAKSKLLKAEKNIMFTKSEENHERFEQMKIYESSVNILNKTMKQNVINQKHKKIEKLYRRGVLSSSILLDSLKQKLSYLKSRNHREITAIRALWNMYKYDGKIFKENI